MCVCQSELRLMLLSLRLARRGSHHELECEGSLTVEIRNRSDPAQAARPAALGTPLESG